MNDRIPLTEHVKTLANREEIAKRGSTMTKQTAKEFVLERYPKFISSKRMKCVGINPDRFAVKDYIITCSLDEWGVFAVGNTFKQAWQNAKTKIEEMEKEK